VAELTIEKAKKIYESSDSMKDLMLTLFSKEELEPHNEVTQSEFDNAFLEFLGQCTKTVFITNNVLESKLPTNQIKLLNKDGQWLFDIEFTGKYPHFWVNRYSVWDILANEFHIQDADIQRLMKNQIGKQFGLFELHEIIPF
jgi:hypothetical protein